MPPGVRVRRVEVWHSPAGVNALRLILQGPSMDSGDGRSKTALASAGGGSADAHKDGTGGRPMLHVLSAPPAGGGQAVYATPWHGDPSGELARFDLDFKPRRASRPTRRAVRTVRLARGGRNASAAIPPEDVAAARAGLAEEGVDEQALDAKGWFPGESLAGADACVGGNRVLGLRFRTSYNRSAVVLGTPCPSLVSCPPPGHCAAAHRLGTGARRRARWWRWPCRRGRRW